MTPIEALAKYDITVHATFIPLSKSRNAKEKRPTLNWLVSVLADGKPVVAGIEYSAGMAHCPAYKLPAKVAGNYNSIMRDGLIRQECETGRTWRGSPLADGPAIVPHPLDVLHSLLSDADAIDYRSFAEWADSLGYDADSIKAESTYRACLAIGLAMRNTLGETALAELREAFNDY